jgi:hypothetical protein
MVAQMIGRATAAPPKHESTRGLALAAASALVALALAAGCGAAARTAPCGAAPATPASPPVAESPAAPVDVAAAALPFAVLRARGGQEVAPEVFFAELGAGVEPRLVDGRVGGREEAAALGPLQEVAGQHAGERAVGQPGAEVAVEELGLVGRDEEPPLLVARRPHPRRQRPASAWCTWTGTAGARSSP